MPSYYEIEYAAYLAELIAPYLYADNSDIEEFVRNALFFMKEYPNETLSKYLFYEGELYSLVPQKSERNTYQIWYSDKEILYECEVVAHTIADGKLAVNLSGLEDFLNEFRNTTIIDYLYDNPTKAKEEISYLNLVVYPYDERKVKIIDNSTREEEEDF